MGKVYLLSRFEAKKRRIEGIFSSIEEAERGKELIIKKSQLLKCGKLTDQDFDEIEEWDLNSIAGFWRCPYFSTEH